ncbi:C13 family peptidase [Lysobacter hankyongensis]|uniref:C13 family peptidase n=1 Tax=Lysobacter hankyongensis TaxID=1176535 RepID=A0ABP9C808_9GAMM
MNARLLPFVLTLALGLSHVGDALAAEKIKGMSDPGLYERERARVAAAVNALVPQRPGKPDLYVVGFGGDSSEDVFRNETEYLEKLMSQRFRTQGRVIALINHNDSLVRTPRPLATLENLRGALAGIGKVMDPEQDVLLLFMTLHGTPDHRLFVRMAPAYLDLITPEELRKALDDAGIRNRVLALSACFSGGFVPALKEPHTLILAAAHRNRTSFGCGPDSDATYFGRAWMIEGLNETTDFVAAFESAKSRIDARERAEGFRPSKPQIEIGEAILPRLQAWRDQLVPGPAVPYDYPVPARTPAQDTTEKSGKTAGAKK